MSSDVFMVVIDFAGLVIDLLSIVIMMMVLRDKKITDRKL